VQVPAAEPAGVGETGPEVGGEPLDHPGAPPLCRLPLQDEVPDAPIHADQLGVDRPRGPNPASRDLGLHRLQQRHVIGGLHFPVHPVAPSSSRAVPGVPAAVTGSGGLGGRCRYRLDRGIFVFFTIAAIEYPP